jgi:hypothetical protein
MENFFPQRGKKRSEVSRVLRTRVERSEVRIQRSGFSVAVLAEHGAVPVGGLVEPAAGVTAPGYRKP